MRRSGILSTVCNVSVLLPIPGSPPSKTMLPRTSPPPSTRLSSLSCISIRGSSCEDISFRNIGLAPLCDIARCISTAALRAAKLPVSADTRSSLKVFHCPQDGHLPIHFADSCPQLLQTYAVLSFAIIVFLKLNHTKVRIIFFVSKFIAIFAL